MRQMDDVPPAPARAERAEEPEYLIVDCNNALGRSAVVARSAVVRTLENDGTRVVTYQDHDLASISIRWRADLTNMKTPTTTTATPTASQGHGLHSCVHELPPAVALQMSPGPSRLK